MHQLSLWSDARKKFINIILFISFFIHLQPTEPSEERLDEEVEVNNDIVSLDGSATHYVSLINIYISSKKINKSYTWRKIYGNNYNIL